MQILSKHTYRPSSLQRGWGRFFKHIPLRSPFDNGESYDWRKFHRTAFETKMTPHRPTDMNPIETIDGVYRSAARPVERLGHLCTDLQHWYQAYPANHYLQPCVIEGKAALVCQKRLSSVAPLAYRALKAICDEYGIFLKEDARSQGAPQDFFQNRRSMAVVLTFFLNMVLSVEAANLSGESGLPTVSRIETQTQAVSLVIKNQTLQEAARNIALRTGMTFKFNAAVEKDMIDTKLLASDWKSALSQFLQDYNYATIQENGAIKTVFITGYKGAIKPVSDSGSGIDQAFPIDSHDDYPDSVFMDRMTMDVDIPTDLLTDLPEGGEMMVDLPVGGFIVKQESQVALEDGTLCWVGTMDDEESFYRLYLAQTQSGEVVGNVFSPYGVYNIETIDGRTVMVEVEQIGMR